MREIKRPGNKKYIRLSDVAAMLSVCRDKAKLIAEEAGSLYKIDRVLLVDFDKLEKHIKEKYQL